MYFSHAERKLIPAATGAAESLFRHFAEFSKPTKKTKKNPPPGGFYTCNFE